MMKYILSCLFLACMCGLTLTAQTSSSWQTSLPDSYVYGLSAKEIEEMFIYPDRTTEVLAKVRQKPLYTTFRGTWDNTPQSGHFLVFTIKDNREEYHYRSFIPYQVILLPVYDAFTVQVVDRQGIPRRDATVTLIDVETKKRYKLRYDPTSKTHTLPLTKSDDFLLITELDGVRSYFNGDTNYAPTRRDDDEEELIHEESRIYSYLITDKYTYKPGDTVRVKSYILSGRRKPLKKKMTLQVGNGSSFKPVNTLTPHRPGSFAGEFVLDGSQDLKLDKEYQIRLVDEAGLIMATSRFRYEDYQLFDYDLHMDVTHSQHFYPDTNYIRIHATDVNNLPLPDTEVDIAILRWQMRTVYGDGLYALPDTIVSQTITLGREPYTLALPGELFGQADLTYQVKVDATLPDYRKLTEIEEVGFYYKYKELVHSIRDSVWVFDYMERGKSTPATATLFYNGENMAHTVQLPHTEPFNPDISHYSFTVDPLCETVVLSAARMIDLKVEAGFTDGFFHASLHNPLGIQTVWYIYRGEELVKKGSGEQISYRTRSGDDETNWYVDVFYRLDDEIKEVREQFIPLNKQLQITTDLPKRVYPGEEVEATIQVKNRKGQPVKHVDLTAFAVNGLLNETFAPLPYYGEIMGERREKDTYWFDPFGTGRTAGIDFDYWKKVAALDTLPFYRFLYPEENAWFIHTEAAPGAITQFAPFVMQGGEPEEVRVIEYDGELIWFSWTSNVQNYSFPVDPDKPHTIKLRTSDRSILIETDPGFFEPGMKTLFSLSDREGSYTGAGYRWQTQSRSHSFSEEEKKQYRQYVSEIPIPAGESYAFLKQGEKEIPVAAGYSSDHKTYCRVGPVAPGVTNYNGVIEYEHTGGYRYDYKGNSVYKSVIKDPVPYLYSNSLRFPYGERNEFYIPVDSIRKWIEQPVAEKSGGNESFRSISQFLISQDNMDVVIDLKSLQNTRVTQVVLIPEKEVTSSPRLSGGLYELLVIYDDGKYLRQDSLELLPYQYHYISLENHSLQEPDDYPELRMEAKSIHPGSQQHLRRTVTSLPQEKVKKKRERPDIEHYQEIAPKKNSRNHGRYSYYIPPADSYRYGLQYDYKNIISGVVMDQDGEPMIGASVVIKGTQTGVITDIDGKFTLTIEGYVSQDVTLVFSYIGYKPREMKVAVGSSIRIQLEEDYNTLDEMVITAYGYSGGGDYSSNESGKEKKESRKGASYTGTLPLEKNEEAYDPEAERLLYFQLANLNRLRSNFSDVGFWQPRLYTNNKGEATFKVTFPDNLTRWDAVVYAMNPKLQTGTYLTSIQSYKPLMAEWLTPAFLLEGDTAYAESLIRDYTGLREINGTIRMTAANDTVETPVQFRTIHQEKYPLYASATDTLLTSFTYTGGDGYMDGEIRQIPVNPIGIPIRKERMLTLQKGDTARITRETDETTTLKLHVKTLDLHLSLADYLVGYEYACNEQLASKLAGLLISRRIRQGSGEVFEYDENIEQIIRRLTRNQNEDGCWGWWNRDIRTDPWITNHVLILLKMAADSGFEVTFTTPFPFIYNLEKASLTDNIELLYAHSLWETATDMEYQIEAFEKLVTALDTTGKADPLREKMLLLEMRKMNGMPWSLEEVTQHLKPEANKYLYCYDRYGRRNEYATMSAYRMLRGEDAFKDNRLTLQYTLVEIANRYSTTWWKAGTLFSIYPDLEEIIHEREIQAMVSLTGHRQQQVIEFPYTYRMEEPEMNLAHQSGLPVFVNTAHESITTEQVIEGPFTIRTWFKGGDTLRQGIPVVLSVEVEATGRADYVMIEVPIPAGCVYDSKPNRFAREAHREYFKEKTVIFIHHLSSGRHHFEIPLLPRFEGVYHLNPAKISKMYAPAEFSTTEMRKVRIAK